MLLESRANYLVLHNLSETDRRVEILGDLASALAHWSVGTRVSPIWAIKDYGRYSSDPDTLAGISTLIFVGPVQPGRLNSELRVLATPGRARVWSSMGCFNVVVQTADQEVTREVIAWAGAQRIPFEAWSVTDGQISSTQHAVLAAEDLNAALANLAALAAVSTAPAVRATLEENLTVTATVLTRAAAVYPRAYAEYRDTALVTQALVGAWREGQLTTLELQSRLVTVSNGVQSGPPIGAQ
jgi:hypothetical protein